MVIKRSSAREVAGLLHDLESGADDAREASVARLSVIGTRAVEGLLSVLGSSAVEAARAGALTALEAIADPRAADSAFACLERNDAALLAPAAGVLRRLVESPRGTEVLDRLAALALDTTRPDAVRLAALDAVRAMPAAVLGPIFARLRDDPSATIRATVTLTSRGVAVRRPLESLEQAAAGTLPEDPAALRHWLAADGGLAPLPTLHRLVQTVRDREAQTSRSTERAEWMTARAAVHQVLAARGSRVALYDLRETVEREDRVPVEMLAALEVLGDRSCLEPIAAAYARLAGKRAKAGGAVDSQDPAAWWLSHLASAFGTIAARETLTERHTVVRRIRGRWPEAAAALLGPPRVSRAGTSSKPAPARPTRE